MDETSDLSYLTDNEKKIIQNVLNRQKIEDEFNYFHIQSRKNDNSSQSTIIPPCRYSQSNESGVLCQICEKPIFVNEQTSRQCSICQKRFCVRCGIRFKSEDFICKKCQEKQEHYFSSRKYLSDYILSQANIENPHGANDKRISLKPIENNDDEISSPESIKTCDNRNNLLVNFKSNLRSINILRDFQYHSLEDKEIGQESTLKDSGIDTASSSTILNVISSDQLKNPITYWHLNDNRTEQIGYIYLKNFNQNQQDEINKENVLNTLGLKIDFRIEYENDHIVQITEVLPGSLADTYGQLQVGDKIVEWNGEKLTNICLDDVKKIISQSSKQCSHIHMIVKRSIRHSKLSKTERLITNRNDFENKTISSTIENDSIQLKLAFEYVEKHLHVMIYGAKNLHNRQGLFSCQLSLQNQRDTLSTIEKCTKAQTCSSDVCIWNQRLTFFDINSIDNILLWIKLINLEHNQEVLGDFKINKFDLTNQFHWYKINDLSKGSSFNRILPQPTDIPSTACIRKRQLPDIPTEQLHAHREKISQDLFQKATQLKLCLHMKSTNEKPILTQRSLDTPNKIEKQNNDYHNSRNSMINLTSQTKVSSTTNLKDKPRISFIRDTSVPTRVTLRRTPMVGKNEIENDKTKKKIFDEKYRKTNKKRYSLETPVDDIDSDGSELSLGSKLSSASLLSTQSERPRTIRKHSSHSHVNDYFNRHSQVELNEKELRQMAMCSNEREINCQTNEINTKISSPINETILKSRKTEQLNDGTLSDSILTSQSEIIKKGRISMSSKALVILGLSKKSNSSSNFGHGKRFGFQRSEEIGVQPHLRNRALEQQISKENETPSNASQTSSGKSSPRTSLENEQFQIMSQNTELWSGALKLPHECQFKEFIEGLGKGQLVGRQVLASPCHGEIQIGLREHKNLLEIEIVRARNLLQKPIYKLAPAPYVKVYLLDGKTCIEKQRTRTTRRTLDPLIQQTLIFKQNCKQKVLQINVWGDYGKLDRKVFMGVCQIGLDEIHFNSHQQILDWYKLFSANSLMNSYTSGQQSSKRKSIILTNN